jgi:hypothetical protein
MKTMLALMLMTAPLAAQVVNCPENRLLAGCLADKVPPSAEQQFTPNLGLSLPVQVHAGTLIPPIPEQCLFASDVQRNVFRWRPCKASEQ